MNDNQIIAEFLAAVGVLLALVGDREVGKPLGKFGRVFSFPPGYVKRWKYLWALVCLAVAIRVYFQ